MPHLFFYGTLMHPEVFSRVVRGTYRSEPAVLTGFARYRVRDQAYPAMIEQPGSEVAGQIRFDVTDDDLARLDRFEGPGYVRRVVQRVFASCAPVECQTYICRPEHQADLTGESWSLAWFEQQGLPRFLAAYPGWSALERV